MGCAKYNPIPQCTMHYSILLVNNMDVTEIKHVLSAVYNSEKKMKVRTQLSIEFMVYVK